MKGQTVFSKKTSGGIKVNVKGNDFKGYKMTIHYPEGGKKWNCFFTEEEAVREAKHVVEHFST